MNSKKLLSLALLVLIFQSVRAIDIGEDGFYLLYSPDDWIEFCELAETNPHANAKMVADIHLDPDMPMIGMENAFQGTFDGQGHELNVSYYTSTSDIAPFRRLDGATIERVHVTGSIESTYVAVGMVGFTEGATTYIRQCQCSATLTSGTGGIGNTIGGFVSNNRGEVVIEDCIFDGAIADKNKIFNAGFICNNWGTAYIRNCLNIGTFPPQSSPSGTFYRSDFGAPTMENVYYLNECGVPQGTAVSEEELKDGSVTAYLQNGRTDKIWMQGRKAPMLTMIDYGYSSRLYVEANPSSIVEGETFQLTISTDGPAKSRTTIQILSENPKKFSFPKSVVLEEGEESVTVDVVALDDDLPGMPFSSSFVVHASGFMQSEAIILVEDNDMPILEMSLTPDKISEDGGPASIVGKLTRTNHKDSKITIKLSDDSNESLYYGAKTLVMDKGVEQIAFQFGPIDNDQVDGDRTYHVTAAVYISSCDCNAKGEEAGHVTIPLQVFDDDGPALKMACRQSTIKEGEQTTLTITRNTTTDSQLDVDLFSDYDDFLEYDHHVLIPIGESSVDVEVQSKENTASDAKDIVVFEAQSEGFSRATCWIRVTDQNLPDATITHFAITPEESEAGSRATAKVTVANKGNAPLPALTCMEILSKDNDIALAKLYLQEELQAGASVTMEKEITIPSKVGETETYAVVNADHDITELSYYNNTSETRVVRALPTFKASVSTDKRMYAFGEKVVINGKAIGSKANGVPVEIYIVNNEVRIPLSATTDAEGHFTTEYLPYEQQNGHFAVGACCPGENATEEQASFDVAGFTELTIDDIVEKLTVNETTNVSFAISNPCSVPMTGINVSAVGIDNDCLAEFDYDKTIPSGQNAVIKLKLKGRQPSQGSQYKTFTIKATSKEGAQLTKTVFYYTFSQECMLAASETAVNTTIAKGKTRDYPITITNRGKGATGAIKVLLPQQVKWLSLASAAQMDNLELGDSATVLLRFSYTEDMQLNVPLSAIIALNCENGGGMQLPITLEPVSDAKGTLCVDVCDEYTYYTDAKPHLAGAKVQVMHPTMGTLIAEGVTDSNGLFVADLDEGYYTINVTADKHDQYRGNLLVSPERTTSKVVNLSVQGVSITWNVVETEVEDTYRVETQVTYETYVPAPVVVIDGPKTVDSDAMAPGETRLLNFTLTNYGLMKAINVRFHVPEPSSEWLFTPLAYTQPFDLPAQQSVTIPVVMTKSPGHVAANAKRTRNAYVPYLSDCMGGFEALYGSVCDADLKENRALFDLALKACGISTVLVALADQLWKGGPSHDIILGGSAYGPSGDDHPYVTLGENETICNPDVAQRYGDAIDGMLGLGLGPIGSAINSGLDLSISGAHNGGQIPADELVGTIAGIVGGAGADMAGEAASAAWGVGTTIVDQAQRAIERESSSEPASSSAKSKRLVYDWMRIYDDNLIMMAEQFEACRAAMLEMFGNEVWLGHFDLQTIVFLDKLAEEFRSGKPINMDNIFKVKPDYVTNAHVVMFIARLLNTSERRDTENAINFDKLEQYSETYKKIDAKAKDAGFSTMADKFYDAWVAYNEKLENAAHSICASVTMQLDQSMVMTRQAFRGTLSVVNGHDNIPMTAVKLHLTVKDENGHLATSHKFQTNLESLKQFDGNLSLDDEWTLDAQKTGTATILFIPTKYAAPITQEVYSFGGYLEYMDPFTGLLVTRELNPVTLTVKPSPELDLDYFVQRDIFGDNPLTGEEEPTIPAEFALIINNKGYGDATNVRMTTSQPQIVDNKKGLYIDFELLSSQVNGGAANLSFGQSIANDFGTIKAHSQAYAQWWLQSSLLGHFTDYDVKATHVTSYGNEDLSLLGQVAIHELIHGFTSDDRRGFLVDDIPDMNDQPDKIYFTDGTNETVSMAAESSCSQQDGARIVLDVTPTRSGWNYGSLPDPTNGRQRLTRITRLSDGATLPIDNMWQTSYTLPDGGDPIAENLLHFVVNTSEAESYLLDFEQLPEVGLLVETINGIPTEGEVTGEPVTSVQIKFNKPIQPASFTSDDITLVCQGISCDTHPIAIRQISETEYSLDLSTLTSNDGFYVLTIHTDGITDADGFSGTNARMVSWVQLLSDHSSIHNETKPVLQPNGNSEKDRHFNISGLRIKHNAKGVHVVKGKKILVK